MMNNGTLPDDEPSGKAYQEKIKAEVEEVIDRAQYPLGTVGGTANSMTCDKPEQWRSGWLEGMQVSFTASLTNTGGVTLTVSGQSPVAVVTDEGNALDAGQIKSGATYVGTYTNSELRIIGTSGLSVVARNDTYTSNGTWLKPANLRDDATIFMEAWGAGGGGNSNLRGGAGGGGAYERVAVRAGDVGSSLTVVVAPASAVNQNGGPSSVSDANGTIIVAYGGATAVWVGGGGGGYDNGGSGQNAGRGGGDGGNANDGNNPGTTPQPGESASSPFGGGGGGGGARDRESSPQVSGGFSHYGGAGGTANGGPFSNTPITAATSKYGGNGGDVGGNGGARGGGGGTQGGGGRGEVRIWTVG